MIDDIKKRLGKAHDGPWFVGRPIIDDGAVMCRVPAGICEPDGDDGKINAVLCNANYHLGNRENDNDFIANAPADIKYLLGEAERLEKTFMCPCGGIFEGTGYSCSTGATIFDCSKCKAYFEIEKELWQKIIHTEQTLGENNG